MFLQVTHIEEEEKRAGISTSTLIVAGMLGSGFFNYGFGYDNTRVSEFLNFLGARPGEGMEYSNQIPSDKKWHFSKN